MVTQSGTVKDGKLTPRATFGNAPVISDLVKGKIKDPRRKEPFDYGENVSQVGMWLALPPRTPDNIVASLCQGFRRHAQRSQISGRIAQLSILIRR